MIQEELAALLRSAFPETQIAVSMNGGHVDIAIESAEFEGLRPVARQQKVYAPLSGLIADGTLHAVNIKANTPGGGS